MKAIRWGMIGCGAVTETKSGPAFYKVGGSELVAVMRRNAVLAQDYAQRHGVETYYDDADALIQDPKVDAVYIATPPSSHQELALKVARAGKPCCVEKPMALTYPACEVMVDAFAAKDLPLFVAYYRRSLPRFLQIKAWLQQGEIGQPRQANWHLCRTENALDLERKPNWRTDPDIGGGYFVDLASHGIDLLQFLLGDITTVHGRAENQQGLYPTADTVSASWKFDSNALGSGSWNFVAHTREDKAKIIGSNGTIEFSVFDEAPVTLIQGSSQQPLKIDNPPHIQSHHVENMIKHLQLGCPHPSFGAEAAKTNWVMDQILNS